MTLKEPQNSRILVYLCSSAESATPCAFKFGDGVSAALGEGRSQDRTHPHISDTQDLRPERGS